MSASSGSTSDVARRDGRGAGDKTTRSDTRSRIVAAAAELLDESKDQSAVGLRAVARRAGLSAPAIYGHFPDVPAVLLVVVQEAFAELTTDLEAATALEHDAPVPAAQGSARDATRASSLLHAVCSAYLDFAARRPQRYRAMFGGIWSATRALESPEVDRTAVASLGRDALEVFVTALQECVDAGASTSTDVIADSVALWLGLHGLADQRAAATQFPWPADITLRLVSALAHLDVTGAR